MGKNPKVIIRSDFQFWHFPFFLFPILTLSQFDMGKNPKVIGGVRYIFNDNFYNFEMLLFTNTLYIYNMIWGRIQRWSIFSRMKHLLLKATINLRSQPFLYENFYSFHVGRIHRWFLELKWQFWQLAKR